MGPYVSHYRRTHLPLGCVVVKYMGSKRTLLAKGLTGVIASQATVAGRFVDLFCGAGSVSCFAATELGQRVLACDLQEYAVVLVRAVIARTAPLDARLVEEKWLGAARRRLARSRLWARAKLLDGSNDQTDVWQRNAQDFCDAHGADPWSLVLRCYGGHYFSPTQALSLDAMISTLPERPSDKDVCLASVIVAASCCAASPGHTAQPFKATKTAGRYLRDAWRRDPFYYARNALGRLCSLYTRLPGETLLGDANDVAAQLKDNDLVFLDPPYSSVQYSRFYHVLETIARGSCDVVEGVGRYPRPSERPKSSYSQKSRSEAALKDLLGKLSSNGCTVVLTFPGRECSNGLSGRKVEEMAGRFFRVDCKPVKTKFSTMGGNKINRTARNNLEEFIMVLTVD